MKASGNRTDRTLFHRTPVIGVVVMVVVISGLLVDTTRADGDNFYSDLIRLDNVATKIHQSYVNKVSSKNLVDKAVNGMLEALDPHTTYFEQKQFEELRIHTEGKFGGLGIQISIRDKVLTVMTPISGTPAARAGIQSGDQILEIDGETTKDIRLDQAVGKLRGEPGSDVTIMIGRKGEKRAVPYTITREIIHINAVPYAGVIKDSIGYVRLSTFSQEAAKELDKSIRDLLKKDIKGLILDLRGNPGGLLPEAIKVAAKFLPRKALVVYTRGRVPGQNKDYTNPSNPVLPPEIPLVVLVNPASASASEIVAGAVQDWDRGVVLGDTTFGKGSVQTILQLDNTHHLKLTTAYYYTPSGRCINRPENASRESRGDETVENEISPDSDGEGEDEKKEEEEGKKDEGEDDEDGVQKVDTAEYKTKIGRIVHGGGGIVPDTIVTLPPFSQLVRALFKKDAFFKFANVHHPKLKKRNKVPTADSQVEERTLKAFRVFLDTIDFDFKSQTELVVDELKKSTGVGDTSSDSSARDPQVESWDEKDLEQLALVVGKLDELFRRKESDAFDRRDAEIRRYIKEALFVREYGSDHEIVYRARLDRDTQVQTAVGLLSGSTTYEDLLNP